MMKFKVRFRLEKALLASKGSICVCLYCHLMGELSSDDDMGRDENQFLFEFFGSSDNDEERRINRGMYEWH